MYFDSTFNYIRQRGSGQPARKTMLQLKRINSLHFSKDWHFRCVSFCYSGVLNICHCSPGAIFYGQFEDYLTLHVRDMAMNQAKIIAPMTVSSLR